MKSVIVAQVKNSFGYIPAFIAHHQRLVDEIILIDHNSDRQLSGLAREGVRTFKISADFFAQELFAAYFLKKLDLRKQFDFLFLLDVDEFLPFRSKDELSEFMDQNKEVAVTSMNWRNGFPPSPNALTGSERLYFTIWRSSTRKLIYNLRKLGDILPIMGNHNAKYPLADSLLLQLRTKRRDSDLGLLHIPFLGLEGLRQKLSDFPSQSYGDKIARDLKALGIERDPTDKNFDLSDEELMTFVANYRTKASDIRRDVSRASFEEVDILQGLAEEISRLAVVLAQCPVAPTPPNYVGEEEVAQRLRKNRVFIHRRLARAFGLQEDGTYAFNLPSRV
ncbi:glycosyltransferase family 2 protein [Agrobacterium rosae]|uniref:glycosyltransferase family 2 protein n=1 Tax=Agrobacterium rosae TaxID=1972867 RepID=UPI0019D37E64|nr:glycosyltransferase family 2 protein [Agrobacterium rosae]MBN7805712.1 glycosyltransferase family 2 protein [Agrobacterium rosae]